MCVVIKVNGLGHRRVSGEPEQFYHSCGTQGADSRDIDVVDVSSEFDTVARRVECLESRFCLRVLFNTCAHVGCERLSDRACQRRCSLEPGADLDAIGLTLSACTPVEPVCRELIATVLDVRACGIDEAGATRAFKTRRVSQQFRFRGTTQQQS